MKTASAGLSTYLDATTNADRPWHLVTITPKSGSVAYWTDYGSDLVYGGHTFVAGATGTVPGLRLKRTSFLAGTEIGTMEVELLCGTTAQFNGTRLQVAAINGTLRGASVLVQRVFMQTPGDLSLGVMHWFEGTIAQVQPSSLSVVVTVEDIRAKLRTQLPRIVFESGCANELYDSICGVSKAALTVTGTVASGSTTTVVKSSTLKGTDITYYRLGVLTFTSGALNGVQRGVKDYMGLTGDFTLDRPLPSVPVAGVTFTVYPGCGKSWTECSSRFSNIARFRGFPYVPKAEAL